MKTIRVPNVEGAITLLELADLEAINARLEGLAATSASHTASLAEYLRRIRDIEDAHDVSLQEISNELAEITVAIERLRDRVTALENPPVRQES